MPLLSLKQMSVLNLSAGRNHGLLQSFSLFFFIAPTEMPENGQALSCMASNSETLPSKSAHEMMANVKGHFYVSL